MRSKSFTPSLPNFPLPMLSTTCPIPVHICEKRTKKAACFIASRFVFGVEVAGFEPAAFWSRTKRATKLRYTSKSEPTEGLEPSTCGTPRKNGANKGTRTLDLRFTKPLLYRLSHVGTAETIQLY